ncbi:MAG: phosphoribosylformylglycinamidine synthase I [Methanoregulaceae archaeon]|jgi:phosphoribosylformylglycinamidine synthase
MRFGVVQFGGSNCDRDVVYALSKVCSVDTDLIWYKERLKKNYDAVILPGGFSYGDYLRAGAIAARTAIMGDVVKHAESGKLVLGICNGAQILAESGLVPGVFTINAYPKFICKWVHLRLENVISPFTSLYKKGDVVKMPIAHAEGRYVAPAETLSALNKNNRVVFRFCDENGNVTSDVNPNGAAENITGVLSVKNNVLAMMPHPERSSEQILGSADGKRIFESMIQYIERKD